MCSFLAVLKRKPESYKFLWHFSCTISQRIDVMWINWRKRINFLPLSLRQSVWKWCTFIHIYIYTYTSENIRQSTLRFSVPLTNLKRSLITNNTAVPVHTMKMYTGIRGIAPLILKLGARNTEKLRTEKWGTLFLVSVLQTQNNIN